MRGPKIIVKVSITFPGVLTPLKLQSIAAKLASVPMRTLARQVRKRHLESFQLSLGAGVCVEFPAKNGLAVEL